MNNIGKFIALFIAVIFPLAFFFFFANKEIPPRPKLKRYIALTAEQAANQSNTIQRNDTTWHTIPNWEFTAHSGKVVNQNTYADKIKVIDYFFTHCPGICKTMSSQMQRIQQEFYNDKEVMLLSYTVDPQRDTVERLQEYADIYNVDSTKWLLLTGNKEELYQLARQGYKITATEGDGGAEDFIHSERFVLIDKDGIIRGFYDGTKQEEVNQLMIDIRILELEYPKPKRSAI